MSVGLTYIHISTYTYISAYLPIYALTSLPNVFSIGFYFYFYLYFHVLFFYEHLSPRLRKITDLHYQVTLLYEMYACLCTHDMYMYDKFKCVQIYLLICLYVVIYILVRDKVLLQIGKPAQQCSR